MAEPPTQPPQPPDEPPEDDETVVRDPGWAVAPERRVATQETLVEEPAPPPRRPTLWPWLLALLVLVLAVLGTVYFLSRDDDDDAATTTAATTAAQQVTVPDVVGRTVDDATTAMEAVGLEVSVVQVPSGVEPGTVVAQAPGGGNEVEDGTTVSLKVARPLDETTTAPPATTAPPPTTTAPPQPQPGVVPDVVGQAAADAAKAFAAEGLHVDLNYVASDEPAGTVVAQAQDPGTELQRGDFVQVNVAAGPDATEWVSLPDVVGLPLDEARTRLERAGFEVLAINLNDEIRNSDRVGGQSPVASAAIPRGSLVVLYVSR